MAKIRCHRLLGGAVGSQGGGPELLVTSETDEKDLNCWLFRRLPKRPELLVTSETTGKDREPLVTQEAVRSREKDPEYAYLAGLAGFVPAITLSLAMISRISLML
jgi:hypothetical protein